MRATWVRHDRAFIRNLPGDSSTSGIMSRDVIGDFSVPPLPGGREARSNRANREARADPRRIAGAAP